MTDRPTSIALPLRWVERRKGDFALTVGPLNAGIVFKYDRDSWGAAGNGVIHHRSGPHRTAEAAQIALERALVEAVSEGG